MPALLAFGLPFPCGMLQSLNQLSIISNEALLNAVSSTTSHWHDGSIKSCHIQLFCHSDEQKNIEVLVAQPSSENSLPSNNFEITSGPNNICVTSPTVNLTYNPQDTTFAITSLLCNKTYTAKLILQATKEQALTAVVTSHKVEILNSLGVNKNTALKLRLGGNFIDADQQTLCEFTACFDIFTDLALISFQYTIHNPKAAKHSAGHWDLDDQNSLLFDSLTLELSSNLFTDIKYQTEVNAVPSLLDLPSIEIEQHASGGQNWQSPVHMDNTQQVAHIKNGYSVLSASKSIQSGDRATPTFFADNHLKITQPHFWQNFPSSMTISANKLSIGFFPQQSNFTHELQAGEKKTQNIYLSLNNQFPNLDYVHQPSTVIVDSEWLQNNGQGLQTNNYGTITPFSALIKNGIEGDKNFFNKRETLDEFGWRNFGDLYADHETANHQQDSIFVSHYNNQYDPIYGFLKQYLINGDSKWFELADDLAKHVVDIDIYHTKQDKDEYNGGLFWHTDHYVQAFTSTHRSYSKHQPSDVYQDHAGGGGPGGQHCYTTGLKLHHQLTANRYSKQAVLTLTNWITHVYEGSGTCLELLLALKNRHQAGQKNHFTGQYPLDRGTANYVVALLDSYELTQDISFLHRAENILLNSYHPNENIHERHLEDVENTWFYTVLLQATCKYLEIKEQRAELDKNFYYCRDALLNFARWMTLHEAPYLQNPDILEYPNDTWTAQDLRKVHVFAAAHYYSHQDSQVFLDKAQYFENDVLQRLNRSTTKTYTRIMVLVMQNYGTIDFYQHKQKSTPFKNPQFNWQKAQYQNKSIASGFMTLLLKRLMKLSLKGEVQWLKKRIN